MFIASDRMPVLQMANLRLMLDPGLGQAQAIRDTIREHYGLQRGEVITPGSPAAILLGYEDRTGARDLMGEIVADLVETSATEV